MWKTLSIVAVLAMAGCAGDDGGKDPVGDDDDDDVVQTDDADGDGVAAPDDCDDTDASVFPGADEVPYDGIDQDCADGDLVDVDGDGFDAAEVGGDDCDDDAPGVNPSAGDTVGNGVDDDCDGIDGVDEDGDGYANQASGGDDCDDTDPAFNPGVAEIWYDGIDQDCARNCDWDSDGDGAVVAGYVANDNGQCDADKALGVIDAPEDCDDTDPLATYQALYASTPYEGQGWVAIDTAITAVLTTDDPAATLTVTDPGGAAVAGTTTVTGPSVAFVPASPLLEDTEYDVTIDHACASEGWSFTTAGPPGPIDPSLVGRVWEVDVNDAEWLDPAGIGDLLAALVEGRTWWIAAIEVTPGFGELVLFPAEGGAQDLCSPTQHVPFDQLIPAQPTAAGPVPFQIPEVDGFEFDVSDFTGAGVPAADGTALNGLTLSYWADTVPWVDLIAPGGGDDAVCALIATFGVSCVTCPDGSSDYCLTAGLDFGTAPEVTPTPAWVERTAAEIAADPACP